MVAPPPTPRNFAVDVARVSAAFQDLARQMGAQFLDKQEIIRLMTISAIAGEHMVIVGPPGTAKSAMIDMFAKLIDASVRFQLESMRKQLLSAAATRASTSRTE